MALLVFLANVTAGLGLGALVLRVLGLDRDITPGEHWAVSFAIGFGVLGWLVFPIGIVGALSAGPLWGLLLVSSLGVVFLRNSGLPVLRENPDAVAKALLALLAGVMLLDLAEALVPPADADSLAYHFNWPKRFIEAGTIAFIPQAWIGAVPLLVQMTYIPPLALGGETALTLWTMASSWAGAALLVVFCRRHLSLNWSLAVALIYLTTPAIIFGGGSGQVEPKMTLFVMAGAWGVARSLETGRLSFAVLAGLAAGFFAGAKYMGLLYVAAAGLVILYQRGGWRAGLTTGAVFGVAAIASGFQWYAWNAVHTGAPVFPMFFEWLGHDDLNYWTADYSVWFKRRCAISNATFPEVCGGFSAIPSSPPSTPCPCSRPDASVSALSESWCCRSPFSEHGPCGNGCVKAACLFSPSCAPCFTPFGFLPGLRKEFATLCPCCPCSWWLLRWPRFASRISRKRGRLWRRQWD